ncbi:MULTISPECIES: DNA-deoxyinosine glycosylase [unclassified Janthinobacterium]|uniref:DNA-deoxyinosine glycosylase n=1 Tax=unclassified Janthinobacterium TaxID=2610881 RepID=UPI001611D415|nr:MULTISPECIES: DNA-deoxyinosine glycosylase [unclassified Janthinobacterium]MBB5607440.1 hypoxanthine-DNA glycosylase [Janthinobacterium sp. S3T4]MBB5612461.1 hypoxanthine-DNA glycosylase [Janthinobacterium sp. S3M3]
MNQPLFSALPDTRKRCFDPVVDARTRLLILGSLPGEKSLAHSQYYAHPQNKFWLLMGEVLGVDLKSLAYEARLTALLAHDVGLWDVVAQAHRAGSLDSNIRERDDNDLVALASSLPKLEVIAFNGGTAARLGLKVLQKQANRYRIVKLPSSSAAHTLPFSEKLALWSALKEG